MRLTSSSQQTAGSLVRASFVRDISPVAIVFCIQPIVFCTWQAGDFLIGGICNWLDKWSRRDVRRGTLAHKMAGQSSLNKGYPQHKFKRENTIVFTNFRCLRCWTCGWRIWFNCDVKILLYNILSFIQHCSNFVEVYALGWLPVWFRKQNGEFNFYRSVILVKRYPCNYDLIWGEGYRFLWTPLYSVRFYRLSARNKKFIWLFTVSTFTRRKFSISFSFYFFFTLTFTTTVVGVAQQSEAPN